MKKVKIPKGNGKFRTIYVPNRKHKKILRGYLPRLYDKAEIILNKNVVHGFMPGKSIVTHASAHIGKEFTYEFDLENFFDWCDYQKLKNKLTEKECRDLLFDGAARQGLPTSPILANMAAIELDKTILTHIELLDGVIYTRYADNLAFSFDRQEYIQLLGNTIPDIVARCQFKINKKKTKLQCAKSGRRIITGIAVGQDAIYPPRRIKRKLRAALHQNKTESIKGLQEFIKLKQYSQNNWAKQCKELYYLLNHWGIKTFTVNDVQYKGPDIHLSENVIITGDPVYILGMSNWFHKWKTCFAQPKRKWSRMPRFWVRCPKVRLGMYLTHNHKRIGKVKRRCFTTRCLIFETDSGLYYTGTSGLHIPQFIQTLRCNNILSLSELKTQEKIITGVNILATYTTMAVNIGCDGVVTLGKG
jgi:hypothetical protein